VQINRIEVLNDDDYRQVPVVRISPGWRPDIQRVHTIGGAGRLRVIDYLVSRKRWGGEWPIASVDDQCGARVTSGVPESPVRAGDAWCDGSLRWKDPSG
jgi:hypothetical protein